MTTINLESKSALIDDFGRLKKDVDQKMQVMRQSVEKVEGAVYGFVVRGTERPKGWVPDLGGDTGRDAVDNFE